MLLLVAKFGGGKNSCLIGLASLLACANLTAAHLHRVERESVRGLERRVFSVCPQGYYAVFECIEGPSFRELKLPSLSPSEQVVICYRYKKPHFLFSDRTTPCRIPYVGTFSFSLQWP